MRTWRKGGTEPAQSPRRGHSLLPTFTAPTLPRPVGSCEGSLLLECPASGMRHVAATLRWPPSALSPCYPHSSSQARKPPRVGARATCHNSDTVNAQTPCHGVW